MNTTALCRRNEITLYSCGSVRCQLIRCKTGHKPKLHADYIRNHYYGYPLLLHKQNIKYLTKQTQVVKSLNVQCSFYVPPDLTFTNSTF